MKKRSFWAFTLGFLVPFLFTTGALYVTTAQFEMLDPQTLAQCLLIIGAVSLLIALFTAFSSFIQEDSPEQDDFRLEIAEEAGIFFRALFVLRKPAFAPFWLALATLAGGSVFVSRDYHILGSLLLLTGQAFWLLVRSRLRHFIDVTPMDNHLHPYLLWTLRSMDAFALASIAGVLGSLGSYGEIIDNIPLLAASALLAATYVGLQAARKKESIDADHALKAAVGFVWAALVIATINFAFDFRAPLKTKRLTYRKCTEHRDLVLSGKTSPQPEMLDCHYFSRLKEPQTESEIEFVSHPGALGVEWKKGRLIR